MSHNIDRVPSALDVPQWAYEQCSKCIVLWYSEAGAVELMIDNKLPVYNIDRTIVRRLSDG